MLKKILAVLFLIIFVGCGHHHHSSDHGERALTLNHSKKWKSDQHTMTSIKKMRKIVLKNKKMKNAILKEKLEQEISTLIRGCTMQGVDHDALHVFLEKLLPEIENLANSDSHMADASRKEVMSLLEKYPEFFEL